MTAPELRRGTRLRAERLCFSFDGRTYTAQAGDTAASALLANRVRLVGRSVKYRRARGVLSAGPEEPNALLTVGTRPTVIPNVPAPQLVLRDGLVLRSQNRWLRRKFAPVLRCWRQEETQNENSHFPDRYGLFPGHRGLFIVRRNAHHSGVIGKWYAGGCARHHRIHYTGQRHGWFEHNGNVPVWRPQQHVRLGGHHGDGRRLLHASVHDDARR